MRVSLAKFYLTSILNQLDLHASILSLDLTLFDEQKTPKHIWMCLFVQKQHSIGYRVTGKEQECPHGQPESKSPGPGPQAPGLKIPSLLARYQCHYPLNKGRACHCTAERVGGEVYTTLSLKPHSQHRASLFLQSTELSLHFLMLLPEDCLHGLGVTQTAKDTLWLSVAAEFMVAVPL